ncbi:hypothetical protein FQN55_008375 [Onygenales sp. PD_40]|nr:hypothetical protein FQN55_008375 [Onygenales sp. PD_40]KAK2776103.1 hypothetical protein FQN52_003835 [Onygenales sp. PD_12]KAK2790965.1 hypothetical protein FQN53_007152 [Emmonsiellopsis sp. PD_33]
MWLDRLALAPHPSGSGTSSPASSRAYSPARRSQHLSAAQPSRPAYSPRSSSLSLATTPNASSSSLPATARPPNGSLHRQNSSRLDKPAVVDPLAALYNIIGKRPPPDDPLTISVTDGAPEKPENLVENIVFGDLSLEEFVQQKEKAPKNARRQPDIQTIEQYEKERDRFQDLHGAIAGCDDVLKSVESYLARFQTDLGVVSAEIESLQSRSTQLNSQLDNRRNLERLLGPAVEEISISPKAVRLISEGPINQDWVKALDEIEARSTSIEANASTSGNVKAVEDVKPLLSDLKDKAIERIRDYLVAQIKAIRSPNINAQIIQQQSLIKYKDLYGFLSRNHPTLAGEISQAYINTMRWYYLSNFTRYNQALDKLKLHATDRNDLLGGDPNLQKSSNLIPGGRGPGATYDPFALGRRMDILRSSNHMALSSYLAEEEKAVHGIEVPFRNFNLALVDNISAEYSFMTEMFTTKSFQEGSRKVIDMFEPVFALGQTLVKTIIESSTDCLGILLCVRLNQHFAFELQRRKVPVADSYINGINMQLWPRFQKIMDMHCESFKRAAAATNRGSVSALSLTGGGGDKQSSAPHFLTQRFGQFLQGILALSSEAGDDEPVSNSLGRLRSEFDALLGKLSKANGDAKRRERFLFNNYSLILTIISDTHGKLANEQKEHFGELIKNSAGKR